MKWKVESNVFSDIFMFLQPDSGWRFCMQFLIYWEHGAKARYNIDDKHYPSQIAKFFSSFWCSLFNTVLFLPVPYLLLDFCEHGSPFFFELWVFISIWWLLPSSPNILGVSVCLKHIKANFPHSPSSEMAVEYCTACPSSFWSVNN